MSVRRRSGASSLGLVLVGEIGARAQTLEPEGYRLDDYRAPTPETVAGGVVIDTEAAYKLLARRRCHLGRRPPGTAAPREFAAAGIMDAGAAPQYPGQPVAAGCGRGALSPELEAYFRVHLEAAVEGVRDRPIVFYCLADCWMSWNATKRRRELGYTQLYWYRDGVDRLAPRLALPAASPDSPAQGADFSAAQVRAIVAAATADKPADLSGKSLENLDLSNLDLRRRKPVRRQPLWRETRQRRSFGRKPVRRKARSRLDHAGEFHERRSVERRVSLGLVVSSGLDDLARRGADLQGCEVFRARASSPGSAASI